MKRSSPPRRHTPLPRSTTRIARHGRVKLRNAKRKARTFARTYGSTERVLWIKSLCCAWCGRFGPSENAHTVSGKGMGRKADANTCAPLCRECHERYDRRLAPFDEAIPRIVVQQAAVATEKAWQALMRNP